MIIALWLLTVILFIGTFFLIVRIISKEEGHREVFQILSEGFKKALEGCGFHINKKEYSVELYEWVTSEDDDVCDDCLDRSAWPPMDIADWMKEGLPQTPEAHTQCSENCRCHLVFFKSKTLKQQPK